MSDPAPWTRRLLRAGLVLASMLVSAALFEAYLRIWPPMEYKQFIDYKPLLRPDPLLGISLRPDMRLKILREDGSGFFRVETNSHGLRDDPYEPDGRRVIMGLGDSFLFGASVEKDETIMSCLQRMLNERSPNVYRTLNAGIFGYSTNQEILYYLEHGEPEFDPHLVIVFFYMNDISTFVQDIHQIKYHQGIPVPDAKELFYPHWADDPGLEVLRFFRYLKAKKDRGEEAAPIASEKGLYFEKTPFLPLEPQMFNREWKVSRDLRVDNLDYMLGVLKHKTRANGAKLMMVYLPSALESEGGVARESYYARYPYPASSWDWAGFGADIEAVANRLEIPFMNLTPAFREHWRSSERSLYFNKAGHFLPEGTALAAQAMFSKMIETLEGAPNVRPGVDRPRPFADKVAEEQSARYLADTAGVQYVWASAGSDVRRALRISKPYEQSFEVASDDPSPKLWMEIYPKSGEFLMNISSGQNKLFSGLTLPPDPNYWSALTFQVGGAGAIVRVSIRPAHTNGEPAVVTPPRWVRRARPPRDPVILISLGVADADRLSVYGREKNMAPALSQLGKYAMVFDDVSAASPLTVSSVTSLLSGADAFTHMVTDPSHVLPPQMATLASVLGRRGYATMALTTDRSIPRPILRDFQVIFESDRAGLQENIDDLFPRVIKWLSLHKEEPFFMFLHLNPVYAPSPAEAFPLNTVRHDEGITTIDRTLSSFFSWLQTNNLFDPSLIIVTADRGFKPRDRESARPGRAAALYQTDIRVPLLIKLPRSPALENPKRVSAPAGLVDVMPTVLDALAMPPPDMLDGQSLLWSPDTEGIDPEKAAANRLFLFGPVLSGGKEAAAVRIGSHKLIRRDGIWSKDGGMGSDEVEYFDLKTDPLESDNLSSRLQFKIGKALPALQRTFWESMVFRRTRYDRFREEMIAPMTETQKYQLLSLRRAQRELLARQALWNPLTKEMPR